MLRLFIYLKINQPYENKRLKTQTHSAGMHGMFMTKTNITYIRQMTNIKCNKFCNCKYVIIAYVSWL